jgi:hypothetical protein
MTATLSTDQTTYRKWDGSAIDAGHVIDWVLNSNKGLGTGRAQYLCRDGVCTQREEDHDLVVETADGHTIVLEDQYVVRSPEGVFSVVDSLESLS